MIRRFLASGTAVASIEFALCGGAFICMLLAVTDFGRLMFTYHEMAEASRVAARYAIVHGSASSAPASATTVANVAAAATPFVTSPEVTVTFSPNNSPGSQVTVAIARPFGFLAGFISSATFTLNSHTTLIIAN
jgi:Flp pilus assembly protein TadG